MGADPVGALVSFEPLRPKWFRTALRDTPSCSAILRSEYPACSKCLIACTLSIASCLATVPLARVFSDPKTLFDNHRSFGLQLVPFQAIMSGILSSDY